MRPTLRKALLVAHIVTSVGWLGGVVASLALALVGATTALSTVGWTVLLPASLGSLVTGTTTALAGPWGLVRHWWVLIKLVLNVLSTGVLLLYLTTLTAMTPHDPAPVVHAAAAAVLLVVAIVLSVYKPRGRTGHQPRSRTDHQPRSGTGHQPRGRTDQEPRTRTRAA